MGAMMQGEQSCKNLLRGSLLSRILEDDVRETGTGATRNDIQAEGT